MGVTLYRPGGSHTVNGVRCEAKVFDEYSYLHNLDTGWFYSPEECYAEKEEDTTEEEVEETTEEEETEEQDGMIALDEMTDDEIRMVAKEKKIKSWHNKSIERLKKEIDEWQPET